MDFQVCDLAPSDLGAAVQLLEELRDLPDSSPMDVAQFIADVNDGAVVVVALAQVRPVATARRRPSISRADSYQDRAHQRLLEMAPPPSLLLV